jgi:hypothetical protein
MSGNLSGNLALSKATVSAQGLAVAKLKGEEG